MTSWDALEAYLLDLVRKVGGVAYVLRDSGGRHLAPRPPPDDGGDRAIAHSQRT